MKRKNLAGQTFEYWTVQDDYTYENNQGKWLCKCRCGTLKYVNAQNLLSGKSKSCGCLSAALARNRIKDLTGKTFGLLKVIRRAPENKRGRVSWVCECLRCGNECVMTGHQLLHEKTVSCGCYRESKKTNIVPKQTFGRLTALYPVGKKNGKGSMIWHCSCKCGGETDVSQSNLLRHTTQSCGCLKKEAGAEAHHTLHFIDGTCIEALKRKQRSDNTSGHTGVYKMKNGRYRTGIGFKGKRYDLGTYPTFEEAVKAREYAEDILHKAFIDEYNQWTVKEISEYEMIAGITALVKTSTPGTLALVRDEG